MAWSVPFFIHHCKACSAAGLTLAALALGAAGCVERTLTVDSEPQGALVYLNGMEAGRTPMKKNFIYYGTYDVELRMDGYHTLRAKEKVWAPIWQVIPFDLIAEAVPVPLEDQHAVAYTLKSAEEAGPTTTASDDLIRRGIKMRDQLQESSNPPAHIAKPSRKAPK